MRNDRRVSLATIYFVLGNTFANAAPLEAKVPMADGVRLSKIVLLPDGAGPFPAIVVRTPYGLPTPPPGAVQQKEDATAEKLLATWAPIESDAWSPKAAMPWTLLPNKEALSPQGRTSGRIGTIVTDIEEAVPTAVGWNLVLPAGSEMSGLPADGNGRVVHLGPQLTSDAVLLGEVTLHTSIRKDAEDADVVARLIALDVVGNPRQLLETLFRARYRAGRPDPTPLKANEAVQSRFRWTAPRIT